jgi:hypothetical protein
MVPIWEQWLIIAAGVLLRWPACDENDHPVRPQSSAAIPIMRPENDTFAGNMVCFRGRKIWNEFRFLQTEPNLDPRPT